MDGHEKRSWKKLNMAASPDDNNCRLGEHVILVSTRVMDGRGVYCTGQIRELHPETNLPNCFEDTSYVDNSSQENAVSFHDIPAR
jgi:hypothetical protein